MKTELKLLAIHGSPRRDGFSSKLHREFTRPLVDAGIAVEEVCVYEKNIFPCIACGVCSEKFICPINDDMTAIYPLITDADIISISSPLYFSSFPSQLKAMIDRCQVFWEIKKRSGEKASLPRKRAVFICTAGSEYNDMFSGVVISMRHFLNSINSCFDPEKTLLVPGLDSEKKINLEIIKSSVRLSERILAEINAGTRS